MQKTKYYSFKSDKANLPKGCQMCVKGEKLVMFVTGVCSMKCFYCPISEQKYLKDVIFANEWPMKSDKDTKTLIEEARLTDAKGAGFTGGDPLARLDRTVKFIKILKKRFGKKFHTHLYAPLNLITKTNLDKLAKAGLDELRLHPDLYHKKNWERIELCADKKYKWDLGIEIPAIPGQEKMIKDLIDYSSKYIKFLNINELEVSDTNAQHLFEHNLHTKQDKHKVDYGIVGSEELAKKLLKYAEKRYQKIAVHYCTTTLKDKVQLANRIKRRAKNAAKKYDIITKEGMLIRGAIYLSQPGKKQMPTANETARLNGLRKQIMKDYDIPSQFIEVDTQSPRILLPYIVVREIADDMKKKYRMVPAIAEEYPTWDNFQVEVKIL